jgi:hypothetical protein
MNAGVCFQIQKMGGLFPLTPALSLGERENRPQLLGKVMAASCFVTHEFYKAGQRLFLLPQGEGQDEGRTA